MASRYTVGQTVYLRASFYSGRFGPYKIAKIGRKYATVQISSLRTERFELDTGKIVNAYERVLTYAEYCDHLRTTSAEKYLMSQGISVGYQTTWSDRKVELATLLGWDPAAVELPPNPNTEEG